MDNTMDKIVALCKRRGFIYQSSEIYGGLNGFWDYGPLGVELKRNVKDAWWRDMITNHDEFAAPPGAPQAFSMVGLDCSIIMHPQVWKCSGHYDLFHDMMQTCRHCKRLFRADHVWEMLKDSDWVRSLAEVCSPGPAGDRIAIDSPALMKWAGTKGRKLAPGLALVRSTSITLSWLAQRVQSNPAEV